MPVLIDWTHKINGHTRHMAKKYSFEELFYACLFRLRINGHTRHMAKQNIHLKNYSMPVFLDWIHRTNGHTGYMAKQILFQKVEQVPF